MHELRNNLCLQANWRRYVGRVPQLAQVYIYPSWRR